MKELILHPADSSEPSELWGYFLKDAFEQVQYHFYEEVGGVGPWRKRVVMVSLG